MYILTGKDLFVVIYSGARFTRYVIKMVVKENEMQQNKNGITMKTSKDNLSKWTHEINEWFLSLNYKNICTTAIKLFSYTCEGQKFTFVYFTTGRVTIKTDNYDKLRCIFLEKHEKILGVALREIDEQDTLKQSFSEDTFINTKPQKHSTPKAKDMRNDNTIRV